MPLKLTVNIAKLKDRMRAVQERIGRAIRNEALPYIQQTWALAALQKGEKEDRREAGIAYAMAIQRAEAIEYQHNGDPLYGRVVVTDTKVVRMEEGTPARNMKSGLLSGPKARRGKRGQRYNVIPIGFGTPGGYDAWQFHGVSPFRTVSDFSPANSWIYPERPGLAVHEEVSEIITPEVVNYIRRAITEWR